MPRLNQPGNQPAQNQPQPAQRSPPPQAGSPIARDIKALNSSILIISQKLKYLVRNEKILGRNLLVLNKKLKNLEEKGVGGGQLDEESLGKLGGQLNDLGKQIAKNTETIAELKADLEYVKNSYAKGDALTELKYVITTINPLEFVTYKEVDELIEKKLTGKKVEGKTKAETKAKSN